MIHYQKTFHHQRIIDGNLSISYYCWNLRLRAGGTKWLSSLGPLWSDSRDHKNNRVAGGAAAWSTRIRGPANAWNTPPGEYGRKTETHKELTGLHKRWSWKNSVNNHRWNSHKNNFVSDHWRRWLLMKLLIIIFLYILLVEFSSWLRGKRNIRFNG